MSLIRSISGLRATLGDSLSPSVVADYVAAFSAILPEGAIVVGRDGRPSGVWIEQIVCATLAACGRTVRMAGVVPTPTVQLLTEHSDAVGGIAITASHNPAPWNGLKFIGGDGVFLDAAQNAQLWQALDTRDFRYSAQQQHGAVEIIHDAIERHIAAVLALPLFDEESKERIRVRKLRAVVDAVNCSGSRAVPQLLQELGVEVIELYCDGSGNFPHTPEPLPENLGELCQAVRKHQADIGIAVDPDADRLVLIGSDGNAIGEEKTVMLAIEAMMRNRHLFPTALLKAVVNLSTSRMARDAAERHGGSCELAPVGEINVVRRMQAAGAMVGGEGSGGVIVPACHYGRDSLVGTALVLWLMGTLSEEEWNALALSTPYAMLKYKQEVQGSVAPLFDQVQALFSDAEINREDGIRADWSDRWVQLRASNTEPIIRIIAEAPSKEEAEELVQRVRHIVQEQAE